MGSVAERGPLQLPLCVRLEYDVECELRRHAADLEVSLAELIRSIIDEHLRHLPSA